jgi:hypothetical protein
MTNQQTDPQNNPSPAPFYANAWSRTVSRPILLSLMALSLAAAILTVLALFAPGQPWWVSAFLCLFVTIEGYSTTLWLTHPDRRLINPAKYRLAEGVVIFLVVRLVTWLASGNWPSLAYLPAYLLNPALLILDVFFLGTFVAVAFTWYRIISTSSLFIRLAPDAAEEAYYATPRAQRLEANQPVATNRKALQFSFAQQFLGGAALILFCAALATYDLGEIVTVSEAFGGGVTRLPLPPTMLIALVVYFLVGFLLLSEGQLAVMEARWLTHDVVRSPGIGRTWHRRGLLLILVIGFLAAFLPIGSTFAFTYILNMILYGVMVAISTGVYLLSALLYSLLAWLSPAETAEAPPTYEPPPTPLPPAPPPSLTEAPTDSLLPLIFSSAFWAVAIVLGITAVLFFLRERGQPFDRARLTQIWAAFGQWWRVLWGGLGQQVGELRSSLRPRPRPTALPEPPRWRFVRLSALSPRDKVRYFYLSTVKRAGQLGAPRHPDETPAEYAQDLKEKWPESSTEVDELTEAFLAARYSKRPFTPDDIPPIKARWQRLKARLRKNRQS